MKLCRYCTGILVRCKVSGLPDKNGICGHCWELEQYYKAGLQWNGVRWIKLGANEPLPDMFEQYP